MKLGNCWSTGNEVRTTTDQQGLKLDIDQQRMKLGQQVDQQGMKLEQQLLINREWS